MTISADTLNWVNSNVIVGLERAERYASRESKSFRTPDLFIKLVASTGETRLIRWDEVAQITFVVDITSPSMVTLHSDVNIPTL